MTQDVRQQSPSPTPEAASRAGVGAGVSPRGARVIAIATASAPVCVRVRVRARESGVSADNDHRSVGACEGAMPSARRCRPQPSRQRHGSRRYARARHRRQCRPRAYAPMRQTAPARAPGNCARGLNAQMPRWGLGSDRDRDFSSRTAGRMEARARGEGGGRERGGDRQDRTRTRGEYGY